jgi:hypothetical protein
MIQLMKKKLFPEEMETLFECLEFTDENIPEIFDIKDGRWYAEDGWLVGENRKCSDAMALTWAEYFGDVFIEFDASTVLPATRDINVTWHGSWNEEKNTRHMGYVFGIEGFWEGHVGFEKSPEYNFLVQTNLLDFHPGETYHVAVGNIGGTVFLAVNDVLALEIHDPDPIDINKYGRVGLEAFCTRVRFKNLKIKRLTYVDDWKTYQPEF